QREAILARFGAADEDAAFPIDFYDLTAAQGFRRPFDLVAAAAELGGDGLRHALLEAEHAFRRVAARRIGGGLRVAAASQHLAQYLDMAHRLIVAPHHAERHGRAPILHGHAGNDGVHRPLARRDRVGMAGPHLEAHAAIVEEHARLRRVDARAEGV